MHPRDASLGALADIGEGVMLPPDRVCFGALFRRHSRPPPPVRGADRGGLWRADARGRRRGAGGLRPAPPQERRLSGPAGCAVVALRRGAPTRQQPPSGDAQGRSTTAGMDSGRGSGHGRARGCSQHARPSGAGGLASRSRSDVGILDGAARGQSPGRGSGCTRTQRQHHALACAAGALASSSGPGGGSGGARRCVGIDGDHVRGRVGGGGGAA